MMSMIPLRHDSTVSLPICNRRLAAVGENILGCESVTGGELISVNDIAEIDLVMSMIPLRHDSAVSLSICNSRLAAVGKNILGCESVTGGSCLMKKPEIKNPMRLSL